MKSPLRLIKILFVLVFLKGCTASYTTVSFEILEPAVVSLPEYIDQVGILNRSPVSLKMFDPEDVKNMTREQLIMLDTLISHNILKSLSNRLTGAKVKAYHHPLWFSRRRMDTMGLNIPLTKREVNDLCREYGTDILISLEYYFLDLSTKIVPEKDYVVSKYYEVTNRVKWAIYLPDSPRPFSEYETHDTLIYVFYFEDEYYDTGESVDKVREISVKSGDTYGNYLVPTWHVISRDLYKGKGAELRKAVRYTNKGEWDSAHVIWSNLLLNEDSVLAARAAYNMAIFYELEDNLDTALTFVRQSHTLDSTNMSESYMEDLEVRILNREQVLKQVER